MIFEEESTPGSPAPGCGARADEVEIVECLPSGCAGRNQADCVRMGSTEKAAPRWLLSVFWKWRGSIIVLGDDVGLQVGQVVVFQELHDRVAVGARRLAQSMPAPRCGTGDST
jgi:hypothetical protein